VIDYASIERRIAAHYLRHFGTTTGRITSKVPSFKELPMNVTNLNRDDLTDTEIELSQLVFAHYHSNPKPGQRSRVSDEFARNMRGDEACLMRLATLIAKMVAPEHADKVGEVAGFYITPARPTGSISDLLKSLLDGVEPKPVEIRITLQDLLDAPVKDPLFGHVNPLVLWAHAFRELQAYYSDVTFDHQYAEVDDDNYRPGIHGDGINIVSVNGAIIAVLIRNNLMDEDYFEWLATDQDEDGWVFSRGGIDG